MATSEISDEVEQLRDDVENLRTLLHTSIERRKELASDVNELQATVVELQAEVERLRDRQDESHDRNTKIEQLVAFAEKKQSGQGAVKVTPEEIQGVTGWSERYSYSLCDETGLPEEYNWILHPDDIERYGSLEMDRSQQEKHIIVDIEGVQSAGVPLIYLNNDHGGEGA